MIAKTTDLFVVIINWL